MIAVDVVAPLLSSCFAALFTGEDVAVESLEDYTLIGVQGPYAMAVMAAVIDQSQINLVKMPFMCSKKNWKEKRQSSRSLRRIHTDQ